MRLEIKIFLLLGIFAIVMSIQATYAQTEDGARDGNYISYENDAIGVNLKYPADWNLIDGVQDVNFVARFWAPGASGLISMDHIYRDTKITPEEIAESHVKRLEIQGNDLKVIESKHILVSNHLAWQLTYSTADHQGHRLTMSEVYVTDDKSRYVFVYSVWDGFPDYLPLFNAMIDSVQIISVDMKNPAGVSPENSSSVHIIPDWVEYNARWWNEGQIDDQTMISSIQFLTDQKIIIMPSTMEIDVYRLSDMDSPEIVDMIKHNAWTWAESDLGSENFLKGIGYLASLYTQDESSSDSKNPDDCPLSFSSRCITGTVTEIFDGDTVRVNGALFRLALISSPGLDEEEGQEAKAFLEGICSVGSDALVDQDDLRPLEGLSGSSRILAAVYCDGLNLNEELVEFNFGYFDGMYCHTSEFADDPWAREGCSNWGLIGK